MAIARRLSIALTRLEAEVGMIPSSRSRIYVPLPRGPSKLVESERNYPLSRAAGAGQA